jgi:hypothetical protein
MKNKGYIHIHPEYADLGELQIAANSNTKEFPIGDMYMTADTNLFIVKANNGVTVTFGIVTVT